MIRRLSQDVVNRIAAGEIVSSPVAALKEIVENSLDAGATRVHVILRDGGYEDLIVLDNGSGILKQDFPLVCERFATSKIEKFDDIYALGSFGFRGEALSATSYVGHVSITSASRAGDLCLGHYRNAVMTGFSAVSQPNRENFRMELRAASENPDANLFLAETFTMIRVRKMFASDSVRGKANRQHALRDVSGTLTRFALQHNSVAFMLYNLSLTDTLGDLGTLTLFASGDGEPTTKVGGSTNILDCPLVLYASEFQDSVFLDYQPETTQTARIEAVIRETVLRRAACTDDILQSLHVLLAGDDSSCDAYYTKYIEKTSTEPLFLITVNERVVSWPACKKAVQSVFDSYSPTGSVVPFIMLSMRLQHKHVDPNVHPCKERVLVFEEDKVINALTIAINNRLRANYAIVPPVAKFSSQLRSSPSSPASQTNVSAGAPPVAPVAVSPLMRLRISTIQPITNFARHSSPVAPNMSIAKCFLDAFRDSQKDSVPTSRCFHGQLPLEPLLKSINKNVHYVGTNTQGSLSTLEQSVYLYQFSTALCVVGISDLLSSAMRSVYARLLLDDAALHSVEVVSQAKCCDKVANGAVMRISVDPFVTVGTAKQIQCDSRLYTRCLTEEGAHRIELLHPLLLLFSLTSAAASECDPAVLTQDHNIVRDFILSSTELPAAEALENVCARTLLTTDIAAAVSAYVALFEASITRCAYRRDCRALYILFTYSRAYLSHCPPQQKLSQRDILKAFNRIA